MISPSLSRFKRVSPPKYQNALGVASLEPHHWWFSCLRGLDSLFPCSALPWLSQRKAGNGASYVLLQEGNHRGLFGCQTGMSPWDGCSSQTDLSLFLWVEASPAGKQDHPLKSGKRCTIYFPLWGGTTGGMGLSHTPHRAHTHLSLQSWWQREPAIPKAPSFSFLLGMCQGTTSPSAGTSGERTV